MEVDFLATTDPRWKDALDQVAHDIYQLPEYLELSARYEGSGRSRSGSTASAFYVRENESLCLIPLLERSLPPAPDVPQHWRDVTSPYGYAAPVFRGAPSWIHKAIGLFTAECRRRDIVSGFLRMHPFLPVPPALAEYGQVISHGETVYVDLSLSESELWSQIRSRLRSYINGLKRAGFQTRFDDWSTYTNFVEAYGQTMARLEADQFYCFPNDYFNDLRTALGEKVHLCSVFNGAGEFACGALVTENQGIMQYHLSGTTDDALPWSPSKLMLHEIGLWAKKLGCATFHLGGGLGAQTDSLLQFKAGFSPLRAAFRTCRLIYDSQKYEYLCARMQPGSTANSYFPQYRTVQSSTP